MTVSLTVNKNTGIMKTQVLTQKSSISTLSLLTLLMLLFTLNTAFGQTNTDTPTTNERVIKGLISDENGPLKDVNVRKKGTRNGVVTNEKGEFTFPEKLKTGDVLLISFIGFETQEYIIGAETTFVSLVLTEAMIEMIGALDANTPYRSKRKN